MGTKGDRCGVIMARGINVKPGTSTAHVHGCSGSTNSGSGSEAAQAEDRLLQRSSVELVQLSRDGDREAFEELYRRYYPQVVRRLTHLVGPGGAVHDLVQETFLQAYQNLKRFRADSPFAHWILRIATNAARTHFRKSKRSIWRLWDRPEAETSIQSPIKSVDDAYPTLQAVHQALERLSPALREAVVLFELEGLTLAEMAAELGIPLHTAASRVRRGREQLRKSLLHMGFTPMVQAVVLCAGEPQ